MLEEKKEFKPSVDYSDHAAIAADPASYLNGDKWNLLLQDEERARQILSARAQAILSPDQWAAFDKFVAKQQVMDNAQLRLNLTAMLKGGGL